MDDLDLLVLEAGTIWGREPSGQLACATIGATVCTYDGRCGWLPGEAAADPDRAVSVSVARSWVLERPAGLLAPPGLSAHAAHLPPPPGWRDDEWRQLTSGVLGPYRCVVAAGQVVSLAHCSRLTERAVEAGVWTAPAHRGHGLASAVVAAWADAARELVPVVFYSAFEDNPASHRVARACAGRPLGLLTRVAIRQVAGA